MNMIMLEINCDIKTVSLKDLDQAKEVLDGWVEIVRPSKLMQPFVMLVDEEGLIKQKDINPIGSYLYKGDIVGKVLIAKLKNQDVIGLEPEDIKVLTSYFKNLRSAYFNAVSNGYYTREG